jgi:hypothetical protein
MPVWGQLGADIVNTWCEFNAAYFDDTLKPIPLVISHAYSNHYVFGRPPAPQTEASGPF